MCSQITDLALAAKWGSLGASGSASSAALAAKMPPPGITELRVRPPTPRVVRNSIWRRDWIDMMLVLFGIFEKSEAINEVVRVHDGVDQIDKGGLTDRIAQFVVLQRDRFGERELAVEDS